MRERELDREHPSFGRRNHIQLFAETLQNPIFGRHADGIAGEPQGRERARQDAEATRQRIEFLIAAQSQRLDDATREVARFDELDLALHRFRIERRNVALGLALFGARQKTVLDLEQKPRVRGIAGRDEAHEDQGRDKGGGGAAKDGPPLGEDGAQELRRLDLAFYNGAGVIHAHAPWVVEDTLRRGLCERCRVRGP